MSLINNTTANLFSKKLRLLAKELNSPLEKGVQGVVFALENKQPPLSPFVKGESNHKYQKLRCSNKALGKNNFGPPELTK